MAELFIRAVWAAGIALIAISAYWAFNVLMLRRVRKATHGLEDRLPGTPAILYFTAPNCQPCKAQQQPALKRLSEELRDQVQVIQVDAAQRPDLANYWGVLSVPTTFIIDSKGRPRGVNHGVASAEKLRGQLETAEGRCLARNLELEQIHSPITEKKNNRSLI